MVWGGARSPAHRRKGMDGPAAFKLPARFLTFLIQASCKIGSLLPLLTRSSPCTGGGAGHEGIMG